MKYHNIIGHLWVAGLVLLGILTAVAAGGNASEQTTPQAQAAGSAAMKTKGKGGAELWAQTCARCHNIRSPTEFSHAEWQVIMHHMRVRANLTGEEQRKILEFLKSAD